MSHRPGGGSRGWIGFAGSGMATMETKRVPPVELVIGRRNNGWGFFSRERESRMFVVTNFFRLNGTQ